MFVQIDKDNNLVAWSGYHFEGFTHQVDVDYDDYTNNPDKYIYIKDTQDFILNPEWTKILLEEHKKAKIEENDKKRDERLASGVEFKGVLFDCDTDQKVNLSAQLAFMQEGDTVIWFGMNNEPVEFTTNDIITLGAIIKDLTTFVWTRNAEIKKQISEAETTQAVDEIVIDYNEVL